MLETHPHWLPIIFLLYFPAACCITYGVALSYDHVEPVFPYISHTGTLSPESCVFAQLLNFAAVIVGFIVNIRCRSVCRLSCMALVTKRKGLYWLNKAASLTGMITALGISIVGNFQATNVQIVHVVGAYLGFGGGFVYMVLQTVISFKTSTGEVTIRGTNACIRVFRVILCILDAIFLVTLAVAQVWATQLSKFKQEEQMQWTSSDPGYYEHVTATVSEWLAAITTTIFISTFTAEFRHFRMKPPKPVYYNTNKSSAPKVSHPRQNRVADSNLRY